MKLYNEDCIVQMQKMIDEGVQVDSVVTDPPYELGFMGKSWDSTGIAFQKETWELAFQLLKPGGHLLAFSGSRTYHRMAVAIEDAGFEIRDQIMWLYGSGFPKSLNIGKAVDKKLGNKRKIIGKYVAPSEKPEWTEGRNTAGTHFGSSSKKNTFGGEISKGNSEYEGWGTALKPAHEPVVMARKPVEGTITENVLKHGTGGINIDGCRISLGGETPPSGSAKRVYKNNQYTEEKTYGENKTTPESGRYPANVMHDGSEEVLKEFPNTKSIKGKPRTATIKNQTRLNNSQEVFVNNEYEDEGSAARYFYCPKVSKSERNRGLDGFEEKQTSSMSGRRDPHNMEKSKIDNDVTGRFVTTRKNIHPTVKPIELMKYLCRLVTPKGGTVLDPFMGSGSTGMAAKDEGFDFIGIEKEEEYFEISNSRIKSQSPLMEFV